jgi:transcription initiation factor IIE alpha subunit
MLHPRVRNTDPLTSWQAAGSAKDLASRHAQLIVDCLEKYGAMGKDGIAAQTGLESNQVARRLNDLERDGKICLTGKVVKSNSGRMEREWKITPMQRELI